MKTTTIALLAGVVSWFVVSSVVAIGAFALVNTITEKSAQQAAERVIINQQNTAKLAVICKRADRDAGDTYRALEEVSKSELIAMAVEAGENHNYVVAIVEFVDGATIKPYSYTKAERDNISALAAADCMNWTHLL